MVEARSRSSSAVTVVPVGAIAEAALPTFIPSTLPAGSSCDLLLQGGFSPGMLGVSEVFVIAVVFVVAFGVLEAAVVAVTVAVVAVFGAVTDASAGF